MIQKHTFFFRLAFTFINAAFISHLHSAQKDPGTEKAQAYALNGTTGFVENKGQILDQDNRVNEEVKYILKSGGLQVQLRKNGFSYQVEEKNIDTVNQRFTAKTHRIDINFSRSSASEIQLVSGEPYLDRINYYNVSEKSITGTRHFKKVQYKNVWDGVDVIFFVNEKTKKVEYDFILQPGARLEDIQLEINGANDISEDNGNLMMKTSFGTIAEQIPLSYEEVNGKRVKRNIGWKKIKSAKSQDLRLTTYDSQLTTQLWGFQGDWDKTKKLTIDPTPNLIWGTYYGDQGIDAGLNMTIDNLGFIYVSGYTQAPAGAGIASSGTWQTNYGGGTFDAFLVKFNSSGVRQWCTYFGGERTDQGRDVAVDNNGYVYLTGYTNSTGFIASTNAWKTSYSSGINGNENDAFVARFDVSNGTRDWSTYYGAYAEGINRVDEAYGIAVDPTGNSYITGRTHSSNFIASSGTWQSTFSGGLGADAFIAKFNSSGIFQWGTYYGGTDNDLSYGIVYSSNGKLYIAGYTASTTGTGIASPGAWQSNFGTGNFDGFLAKFDANTGTRNWGTYYGGTGDDNCYAINYDRKNGVYVTGTTGSSSGIATAGTWRSTFLGASWDTFVAKFDTSGTRQWGTYYGGELNEYGYGIDCDNYSNAYVTGYTSSTSIGLIASANAWQTSFYPGGTFSSYVVKFDSQGNRSWGTYYGGTGSNIGNGILIDNNATNVYTTGSTASSVNITAGTPWQPANAGGASDAFVAKFSNPCTYTLFASPNSTLCYGTSMTLTASGSISYSWTPASKLNTTTGASVIASPTSTSIFSVTEGACGLSKTLVVTVQTQSISSTPNNSICPGSGQVLSVSSLKTATYAWSPPDGLNTATGSVVTAAPTASTTYSVTESRCNFTSVTTVFVKPLTAIDVSGSASICFGESASLSATSGLGTYNWSPSSYLTSTTGNFVTATHVAGTINYSLTITPSDNFCYDRYVIPVNTWSLPPVSISPAAVSLCSGGNTVLSAISAAANTFLWSPAAEVSDPAGNPVTVTPVSGNDLTVTVTDINLCQNTATVDITLFASPSVTVSAPKTICTGSTTLLSASSATAVSYLWDPSAELSSSTGSFVSATPLTSHDFSITVTDSRSCKGYAVTNITVIASPTLTLSSNGTLCSGKTLSLNASGATSFTWIPSTGLNCWDCSNPVTTAMSTITYSVVGAIGECADTAYVTVIVFSSPTVDAGSDTTILYGDSIQLNAAATAGSSYSWSPDIYINCNTCIDPIVTPLNSTTYYLTVTNGEGCSVMDSVTIYVDLQCNEFSLFLPNVFSPNGDGENEVLYTYGKFECLDPNSFVFEIYNRWGNSVFITADPYAGWDGTFTDGKELDPGVFIYRMTFSVNHSVREQRGNITLIR